MKRSRKKTSPASECFRSWEALHAEPPPTLFHYTTAEGLLGIMQKRGLWATHMRFLNDFTDLSYGARMVRSELERFRAPGRRPGEIARRIFGEVRDGLLAMLDDCEAKTKHFIVCFCESDDLLSQWRGYASVGGGFALGFRSNRLLDFCSDPRDSSRRTRNADHDPRTLVMLRRVVYGRVQQRRIVRGALDAIWRACSTAKADEESLQSDCDAVARQLYECAACFKD
jgi:hypothetical protein